MRCTECVHYREFQKLADALATASPRNHQVHDALAKILQEQDDQREHEFGHWVESFYNEPEDARWAVPPVASACCEVVRPAQSQADYFMAEIRDAAEKCPDFSDAPLTPRSCQTCRYRVPATSPENDSREFQVRLDLLRLGADHHPQEFQQRVGSESALEVRAGYTQAGKMASRPRYLDHCQLLSHEEQAYVLCAVRNPDARCQRWRPAT